jgi:S1-C subfamily serine protease
MKSLQEFFSDFGIAAKIVLALATILTTTVLTTAICRADEKVYQKTVESTVWILGSDKSGSGILIDAENRLVVTNHHVVEGDKSVIVFFPDKVNDRQVTEKKHYIERKNKIGIRSKVIATDVQRDVALLQLERLPSGVQAIKIGKPAKPGAEVHSVGNPGDSDALWIYTSGKVRSNYYRIFSTGSGRHRMQVLETQSPINKGDSGGPIVNGDGALVGISQSFSKGRLMSHGVDISEIVWFIDKVRSENKNLAIKKSTGSSNPKTKSTSAASGLHKVSLGSQKTQEVFVSDEKDVYQSVETRRVWALAKTYEGQLPIKVAVAMLEQNSQTKMGGWVVEKDSQGKTHLIFLAHADANLDDKQMQTIVEYVAKVADAMKKELGN